MLPCSAADSRVTATAPVVAPPPVTNATNICSTVVNRLRTVLYQSPSEIWQCLELFRQLQPTFGARRFATPVQPDSSQLLVDASVADELNLTVFLPERREPVFKLTPLHPYYDDVLYMEGDNRPLPYSTPLVDVQGGQLLRAIEALGIASQRTHHNRNLVNCGLHFLIRAEHPGFFATPTLIDGTQVFINGSAADKITFSLHTPGYLPRTIDISPLHPSWCHLRWRFAHISGMGHSPEITIAGSTPGAAPSPLAYAALGSAEMSAGQLIQLLASIWHPSQYTAADHVCIRALLNSINHERNTQSYCTPILPDFTRLRITKTESHGLHLSVFGPFLPQPINMEMTHDHPAYTDICRRLFFHRPVEVSWPRSNTPGHTILYQRTAESAAGYYAFARRGTTPDSILQAEQRAIYQSITGRLPQTAAGQPTLAQRIHLWLPHGKPVPPAWEHFVNEENAQYFNLFLDKLAMSKARSNPAFRHAVADLLQEMEHNPALRKQVFAASFQASLSCSDRATLGWNTIQAERLLLRVKQAPAETPPAAFVTLARQIFHLKCIDKIAQQKVQQLYAADRERGVSNDVDEIEVFLAYQIQLGKRFPLPENFASEMMFHTMSRVTNEDIEKATKEIARKDEHKFYPWVTRWKPCQDYLISLLPESERDKVADERAEMFDVVLARRHQECRSFMVTPDATPAESSSTTPSASTKSEAIELERTLGPQAMAETDSVIFGRLVQTLLGVLPAVKDPSAPEPGNII